MKKQRELDEMKNNNEKKIEEKNIIIAPKIEIKNIDENKEELKSDRMTIEIDYIDNKEGIANERALTINKDIIKDIIENKIEVIPNETCRFIYTKTMADIIESLTALCYLRFKIH